VSVKVQFILDPILCTNGNPEIQVIEHYKMMQPFRGLGSASGIIFSSAGIVGGTVKKGFLAAKVFGIKRPIGRIFFWNTQILE
jgi:hypothetical protein